MAKQRSDRADEYHKQFAERIIEALKAGTAPWQKPWRPGERVLPHNFSTGRDYRGGNAVYLAMQGLDRGYTDPRWGGYRQIEQAGGHVRKGEKGTPIMYVEFDRRVQVRDERGKPVLDGEGRPTYRREKRDRPLTKIQHVFNVEQTEGLKLRPLDRAAPEWEGHQRAEAVMRNSGVRIDHVAGDRAYYNRKDDRVVLPERSQFPSQASYTHTALHELGHATGHEKRLNRPTLTNYGGFGSETYAREELRAEISAMMAGEKLGVGHEPRHGTAYVASWVKALEDDPREIRAACVDAQRMSDWLVERERERAVEKERPAQEQPGAERTPTPEPERAAAAPGREDGRDGVGDMSKDLEAALRGAGARGYEQGYRDAAAKRAPEPWVSAREAVPQFAGERTPVGVELRYVLERAHSQGYERGFDDRTKGRAERPVTADAAAAEVGDRGQALWKELRKVQREHGAASYVQGYDDAAGDRPERRVRGLSGDAAQDLVEDVRVRGYKHGYGEGVSGAVPRDVAVRKAEQAVSYAAVARFGKHNQVREEELARRGVEQPDRTGTEVRDHFTRDAARKGAAFHRGDPVQDTDRARAREVERDPAPSR